MNLRTANKRTRRKYAHTHTIYTWVTWRNGKEYVTYKRPQKPKKEEYVKCRNCESVFHNAWVEPNGLCPLCY